MYVCMYVCVRAVECGSEFFRIDSCVIQSYFMSPCLLCVYGCSDERGEKQHGEDGNEFMEERREWTLPDPLYAGELFFLCVKSEEDLKVMVKH